MKCTTCGGALVGGAQFCTNCGAAVPTSPAVAPADASVSWLPPPTAHAMGTPPPHSAAGVSQPAVVGVADSVPGGGRKKWAVIGGVGAGVVALGVVAFSWMGGADGSSGAASPTEAATGLAASLSSEDYVAAIGFLAPDEVDGMDVLVQTMQEQAKVEGLSGFSRGEGLDLSVEVAGIEEDTLSDDAAMVSMEVTIAVSGADVAGPLGQLVGAGGDTSFDLDLIMIKIDGGWYVSPMLSLGEFIAEQADLPSGDYDEVSPDDPSTRAETSVEALEIMAEAAAEQDIDTLVDVLAPGEARFLRVFRDAAEELLDERQFEVSGIRSSASEAEGGVVLDELNFEVSEYDGAYNAVEYSDGCLSVNDDGRECPLREELGDTLGISSDDLVWQVVSADGNKRVALIQTFASLASTAVQNLDRATVLSALGLEVLDDAETAQLDTDIDGTLEDDAYKVYEVTLDPDATYSVRVEGADEYCWSDDFAQYDDGAEWQYWYDSGASVARVVVRCDGATNFTLRINTVITEQVSLPLNESGTLPVGGRVIYEFNVDEPGFYELSVTGEVYSSLSSYTSTSSEGYYELAGGANSLAVYSSGGETRYTVELTRREPATLRGFSDGSMFATVDLTSGSQTIRFSALTGDSIEITASPDDGQDVTLHVLECSNCSVIDQMAGGGAETMVLDVSGDGYFTIEVGPYSTSDLYGTVTIYLTFN